MLTAEQLLERRTGIGASEAGAVLGVSPYRTPLDVWREKTSAVPPEPEPPSEAARFGHLLEDVVAREYGRRMDVDVRRSHRTWRHPDHPFMLAHLDRIVTGRGVILECKTSSAWRGSDWAPSGATIERADEGGLPDEYMVQVQHQIAVYGKSDYADLAVLIGGNDFRIYHVERDDKFIDHMIDIEADFWGRYVERREPPPPMTMADIESLYPLDDGSAVDVTDDDLELLHALVEVRQNLRSLQRVERETKLDLAKRFGSADRMIAHGRVVATMRAQERKGYTVEPSTSRPLRINQERLAELGDI